LATDPEARVRFPALPEKKVVGLERGAPSLVSTTEELLDRKVAAPGLERGALSLVSTTEELLDRKVAAPV
jgi:hypothetical protein